ncbi:hypothetical protein DPMN_135571 [Dreissena polymorpha]|uniref:Uncharacterized protein n=1 Tax=Dreissena polymorpha TaxID=45954 RepID=A0A9D4G1U3_DREPO|nr:hypothetical protein DPMN_135571 [Dreissena polymorpha]
MAMAFPVWLSDSPVYCTSIRGTEFIWRRDSWIKPGFHSNNYIRASRFYKEV